MPEEKIRPRYQRLWDRVCQAMVAADATHVYDSSPHTRPLIVAQLTSGIRGAVPTYRALTAPWPRLPPG